MPPRALTTLTVKVVSAARLLRCPPRQSTQSTPAEIDADGSCPPDSQLPAPDLHWYKDAIFYELHVKAFYDSNADGIGDFRGLIEKLDYLQDLGSPASGCCRSYPSPLRDDGYDIADYYGVHPTYGTLARLRSFHRRGAPPRAAGHHRAGDEPHLGSAPLVPGGAQRPELAAPRLLCLERHRPEVPGRADHLHRHRALQLDLGSGGASNTSGTASSATSPT